MPVVAVNRLWMPDLVPHPHPKVKPPHKPHKPAKKHPKAFLLAHGGAKFVFPYAPIPVSSDGYAGVWSQNPRPGRKPLLQRSGLALRTMTYTAKLYQGGNALYNMIELLKRVVGGGQPVTFSYGSTETGIYQVTGLSIDVVAREYLTNHPTEADAHFTLTEQSLASLTLGPLTGGLPPTSVITAGSGSGSSARSVTGVHPQPRRATAPAAKHFSINGGESIANFSLRTTGTPANWRAILTASHITSPKQLHAGLVLTVPYSLGPLSGSADQQYSINAAARAAADQWQGNTPTSGMTVPGDSHIYT